MPVLALVHWLFRRTLASPVAWVAAVFLTGFAALLLTSSLDQELGLGPVPPIIYELAFMGALFGSCTALSGLEELQVFFVRLGPVQHLGAEGVVLLWNTGFYAALPLLPVLFLARGIAWNGLPLELLATITHLTALALLLLRLPWLHATRGLALLVLAWFLPALLPPEAPIAVAFEVIGPRIPLSGVSSAPLVMIAPIIALLIMVVALDTARRATS